MKQIGFFLIWVAFLVPVLSLGFNQRTIPEGRIKIKNFGDTRERTLSVNWTNEFGGYEIKLSGIEFLVRTNLSTANGEVYGQFIENVNSRQNSNAEIRIFSRHSSVFYEALEDLNGDFRYDAMNENFSCRNKDNALIWIRVTKDVKNIFGLDKLPFVYMNCGKIRK